MSDIRDVEGLYVVTGRLNNDPKPTTTVVQAQSMEQAHAVFLNAVLKWAGLKSGMVTYDSTLLLGDLIDTRLKSKEIVFADLALDTRCPECNFDIRIDGQEVGYVDMDRILYHDMKCPECDTVFDLKWSGS